jgi:small subunit ribosomal protein S7
MVEIQEEAKVAQSETIVPAAPSDKATSETQSDKTPELAPLPEEAKTKRTRIKKVAETTETATEKKEEQPKAAEAPKPKFDFKIFGRWSADVQVVDLGLKPYLNLTAYYVPYTAGRTVEKQFWKSKKSIVERLMARLMVSGHKGKKHYWTSNVNTGKITTQYKIIKKTFELIEQRTKKNPIEVLVRAFEVGSPKEGIATIEYGGVRYPKSADLAPQRRVDLALRWMTQGSFIASRKGKKAIWEALADEIMGTAAGDQSKSNCLAKKLEIERQAGASR